PIADLEEASQNRLKAALLRVDFEPDHPRSACPQQHSRRLQRPGSSIPRGTRRGQGWASSSAMSSRRRQRHLSSTQESVPVTHGSTNNTNQHSSPPSQASS